eukprot:jgi/Hompol1/6058/HPOL_000270-RA
MQPIRIKAATGRISSGAPGVVGPHNGSYSESSSFKIASSPGIDLSTRAFARSPGKSGALPMTTRQSMFRQNYVNPCNPIKNVIRVSSQARRWEHLFPKLGMSTRDIMSTNWKPLCTPGYMLMKPKVDRRQSANTTTATGTRASTLHQQIYQPRLTFSITTPFYVSLGDHVHRLFYDASGNNVEVKRYIRRIGYDTDGISYSCAIWRKNMPGYENKTINFSYSSLATYNWNYLDHLIAGYQEEMTDALRYWRARFLLIPTESVSTASNLVGQIGDALDEEEVRIVGFNKFIDALEKARWVPLNEAAEDINRRKTKRAIDVQFTTFDPSSFVRSEVVRSNELLKSQPVPIIHTQKPVMPAMMSPQLSQTQDRLSRSSGLLEIAQALQGPNGPSIRDRWWHFTLYERVCIGSDCVDWLMRSFADIYSRDEATEFGNYLLDKGVLIHVYKKHRFLDGFYFYRVGREYDVLPQRQATSKPAALSTSGSPAIRQTDTVGDVSNSKSAFGEPHVSAPLFPVLPSSTTPMLTATSTLKTAPLTFEPFKMTEYMFVDMDPQRKSTRQERAVVHYDTTHNPKNCYHIELHWLVCTPRLIEDMLSSWARVAEKCSLKFVEAPVEQAQPFSDDNPFQSVISITLALPAPRAKALALNADLSPLWFETELLRSQNFVLDVEADNYFPKGSIKHSFRRSPYRWTQYVHRSGVAFVQICDDGKFLWVDNRVFLASSGTGFVAPRNTPALVSPDTLRSEFQRLCQDSVFLAKFWADAEARIPRSLTQSSQ